MRSRSVRVEVRECGWRTDGPWRVVSALGFRHEGALLGRPFGVRSASTRAVGRAMVCHDTTLGTVVSVISVTFPPRNANLNGPSATLDLQPLFLLFRGMELDPKP